MPPISKSGYDMGDELNPKLPNREVLNVGFNSRIKDSDLKVVMRSFTWAGT